MGPTRHPRREAPLLSKIARGCSSWSAPYLVDRGQAEESGAWNRVSTIPRGPKNVPAETAQRARRLLHQGTEHVGGDAVGEGLAGLVEEGRSPTFAIISVRLASRAVVLHVELVDGAVSKEAVGHAGGVSSRSRTVTDRLVRVLEAWSDTPEGLPSSR